MNNTINTKVPSFCHTIRDDGVGLGDYLDPLTYLLFLKMADETPNSTRKSAWHPYKQMLEVVNGR